MSYQYSMFLNVNQAVVRSTEPTIKWELVEFAELHVAFD